MTDPYLYSMLHGEGSPVNKKKTDRFDEAIDQSISLYIDNLPNEEDDPKNKLITSTMRHEKLREELREMSHFPELQAQLETAFNIIIADGKKYLEPQACTALIETISDIGNKIQDYDLKSPILEDFQTLLGFTDNNIESIFKLALVKFNEKQYFDCLGLFSLMTTLHPDNPDYWNHVGIAEQRCNNLEVALRAYAIAICENPDLLEPRIFSAECYLKLGNYDDAEAEYLEAVRISENEETVKEVYKNLLSLIKKQVEINKKK